MKRRVARASRFTGRVTPPGDKSISHRALLFAAIAQGTTRITNLGPGDDVRATVRCLHALGVDVALDGNDAVVEGVGLNGLVAPSTPLDCGNSGTTMRLLAGMVAGARIPCVLDGDASLRRRPMGRILTPLRAMGAHVSGVESADDETAPLRFAHGGTVVAGRFELSIASAQVKSCLMLAALYAHGQTVVIEPSPTRDHTERMLSAMGATIGIDGCTRTVSPPAKGLRSLSALAVPGDPSSAAYFIAAAILVASGRVELEGVDVNPTRTGILDVLRRMGADIRLDASSQQAADPVARIVAAHRTGSLVATAVEEDEIPALIDEVPLLAVVATQAVGTTVVRGAHELRRKESDRITAIASGLKAMGARVEEYPDGLAITGPTPLRRATVDAFADHRIAMSLAVAGLVAEGGVEIEGAEWTDVSFPGFFTQLDQLTSPDVDGRADQRTSEDGSRTVL